MAYVDAPDGMQWTAQDGIEAVGVVVMLAADSPYVNVDFTNYLQGEDLAITAFAGVTEKDAKTISLIEPEISGTGKKVSFKIDSNGGADDYTLVVPVTVNKGTGNVRSWQCVLRVQ